MATIFDTINKMYNGKETEWQKTPDYEKASAYFLLNRCMAMINPVLSAELSRIKIFPSGAMDYWQSILSKQYSKTPSCFYNVSPKKKKEEKLKKSKQFIPTLDLILYFCDLYDIDFETYTELESRYKDDLLKELELIQKEIQNNVKSK